MQQLQIFKNEVGKRLPKCISKADLRQILGNGEIPVSWYTFHTKFFTEDVIRDVLKMTDIEFKKVSVFSFLHTSIIYQHFQIDSSDIA